VNGLSAVRVEREGAVTKVLPLRNLGDRRGLEEIPERADTLTEPDQTELGRAVRRGLGDSDEQGR
jgi:hypothetical protein